MPLAKDAIMADWLTEFQGGRQTFNSPALFLQLRQALAAASAGSASKPDAFSTAAVCECLSRLPESAGSFSRLLQLLRAELLRSIYEDYDAVERRDEPADAAVLLGATTYFSRTEELRRVNAVRAA